MFTTAVAYLTALAAPTQGQLAADGGTAPIDLENPPTLVLALIGIGTLAIYGVRWRKRGKTVGAAASAAGEATSASPPQPAEAERAA